MNSHRSKPRLALLAGVLLSVLLTPSLSSATDVGDVPPDLLGRTLDGKEVRLSDSSGRIRVVSFWATWCAPCRKELPLLAGIQEQGGKERIEVIAINLEESRTLYRKAVRAMEGFNLQFVHDRRGTVAKQFGVTGIPHLLIVDADGRVAFKKRGYGEHEMDTIVAAINDQLLKQAYAGD